MSACSTIRISRRSSCGTIATIVLPTLKLFERDGAPRDRLLINERRVHGAWNFLFDPQRTACDVPAIWRSDANPSVVIVSVPERTIAPLARITRAAVVLADHTTRAGRHLVIAINRHRHRLLIGGQSPALNYILPADAALAVRVAATNALHASMTAPAAQCSPARLGPSRYQRHRLTLLLAILDRLDRPGEPQPTCRELAHEVAFPGLAIGSAIDWKSSSHRRQVQRLVLEARRMASGGYHELLRHDLRGRSWTAPKAFLP